MGGNNLIPNGAPRSILTLKRPELWGRALTLATNLTGYIYAPKLPAADGTIWACGWYVPKIDKTPTQIRKENPRDIQHEIKWRRDRINTDWFNDSQEYKDKLKREIKELEKELENGSDKSVSSSPIVYVPEGAMEWLLHEVGHYVAATPEERLMKDYGYGTIKKKGWGKARELQAWGFEEIILSPFGNARLIAPPEHRGGTAFEKAGPISDAATHHAAQQMKTLGVDAEQWRVVYGEWIDWERKRKQATDANR